VAKKPTWMINCGVRKLKKTMQSRPEIWPSIIFGFKVASVKEYLDRRMLGMK
jgi:hypothetical protein